MSKTNNRETNNDKFAILVGINNYINFSHLKYAVDDAELIDSVLQQKGRFKTELITDNSDILPTRERILGALNNANEISKKGSISTFVFYFSGHGFHIYGKNYLSLMDTHSDALMKLTALGLDDVLDIIFDIQRTAKTIVFIDSCRVRTGEKGSNDWDDDADKNARGLGVLFSTSKGAPSFEDDELRHGTFSHYLYLGLNGEADRKPYGSGDGVVSFKDIVNYIQKKMSSSQIPRATNVEQYGDFGITRSDIIIVEFPDRNLGRIVSNLVHKPEGKITSDDLEAITELNLLHKEISNFTGLEHCNNLKLLESTGETRIVPPWMGFARDSIPTYIVPLSTITSLETLRLPHSGLTDISPLADLVNIKELILAQNRIKDITPLSKLTNLEKLGIGDNYLSSISSLSNLTKLRELALSNNHVIDVAPLASITSLSELYLSNNKIGAITALSDLKTLRILDISHNKIANIVPISVLKNLEKLTISYNKINDLKPISDLTNLKELEISGCQIEDLSFLIRLKNLEKLDISDNDISDISILSNLKNLRELDIQGNRIRNLTALSSMTNLAILRMMGNEIALDTANRKTLNILKDLGVKINSDLDLEHYFSSSNIFADPNLETAICNLIGKSQGEIEAKDLEMITDLDVSDRCIRYLAGLEYCINIVSLNLSKNKIYLNRDLEYNLNEFHHLTKLKTLNLSESIKHLSYDRGNINRIFQYLPSSLQSLSISNNELHRMNSRFPKMPNLLTLDLSHNGFSIGHLNDIFSELDNIESLDLSHNYIGNLTPLQGLKKLKSLNIEFNDLRFKPGKRDYQILHNLIDNGVDVLWKSGNLELDASEVTYVITDDCVMCGTCYEMCPVEAILMGDDKFSIDPKKCTCCGDCVNDCPAEAVQILK